MEVKEECVFEFPNSEEVGGAKVVGVPLQTMIGSINRSSSRDLWLGFGGVGLGIGEELKMVEGSLVVLSGDEVTACTFLSLSLSNWVVWWFCSSTAD